ncbi:MAG: hypothetical protein KGL65_02045 [Rhodospirillales bacterium]|nr:hypothetical protein [Rhodospirillales bacterium]MDE2390369.1 hypothetical protein [Rhodospirillales bacterium]
MPPLVLLLLTVCAAGFGFAAATWRTRARARREPQRPPRGFRPVVIEGGKAALPAPAQDAVS